MCILYEICPYLKFGYMATNVAIADAGKSENHTHIIDYQIAQGTQWLTLFQALAATPVGRGLVALSEKFSIDMEFHGVPLFAPAVTIMDILDVRPRKAQSKNQTQFLPRFIGTLNYYLAMIESIDGTLPRDSKERINVEQHCLARDIVNCIACGAKERVEHHGLIGF
ncbi:hypothetical protein SLEP1_g26497 [Rubroshorea leprosula]|uniref:Uncharacterized protein n=1 Tax=Rubroshorea leprosula TaxID=152421 RepID=A0AAV5JWU5_9ROSI|nr:hypothetical protein SLEP1_g26497 [Rubroshorea leprosula]